MRLGIFFVSVLLSGFLWGQPAGAGTEPRPSGLQHSQSISADQLWPGLATQFSLTGLGYLIHQWEAASAGFSHADTSLSSLLGRVSYGDGSSGVSGHATEMAEIMIGNSPDSSELGVAYEASVKAFNISNRWPELKTEAASGMKLSLHAYASNYGWGTHLDNTFWWGLEEVDSTEDYHFGLYDWEAQSWDSLVYNNPQAVVVKSAGNLRGKRDTGLHYFYNASIESITADTNYFMDSSSVYRPPVGGVDGYDCLPPGSLAKNILTIGAVNFITGGWNDTGDVLIHAASGVGPVDDGRIKPDLVAAGEKTSQSSASVAGAIALLQELFVNTYARFPLASTIKALLVHTADEAGAHPGPDYKHGWGMANALRAAQHLNDTSGFHHLFEDTLSNGDTLVYHFFAESDEIKASICWTDPAAAPLPFSNSPVMLDNPQPMLVNDLDIRLIRRADQSTTYPYTLNPLQASQPAQRADNLIDNVEQIDKDDPQHGWYTLRVYHKAALTNGSQVFSLMVSGGKTGLVWNGIAWSPFAPGANTAEYDVLIMENTSVTIPPGFKARNLILETGAQVKLQ